MSTELSKTEQPCTLHGVSNSTLDKCIELFDKLTATEKLIVMDKTCKNCGNTIENWVCDKCENPC
jgi:hypothetical protein